MLTFSNAKKTQKSTEKAIKQEAKRKNKEVSASAEAEVVVDQEQHQSYEKLQEIIDEDILVERRQGERKRKKKMK